MLTEDQVNSWFTAAELGAIAATDDARDDEEKVVSVYDTLLANEGCAAYIASQDLTCSEMLDRLKAVLA